jgi:spore germination cell wall hydrolase CwlJ-like protein
MILVTIPAFPAKVSDREKEIDCLARAIYHEARGESEMGKKAVAMVTINRANSSKFPNSICRVVYEKGQYSWTRDKGVKITDFSLFYEIRGIAENMYTSYHINRNAPRNLKNLENALYFSVYGFNNKNLKFVAKIGGHRFYTLKEA